MGWRSGRHAGERLRRRAAGSASNTLRAAAAAATVLASGCGDGGAAGQLEAPPPAKTFALAGFRPAGEIAEGRPTDVSFAIQQPSGRPLTTYATGDGPHTGVHLMLVRDDLSQIIHRRPPVGADGRIADTLTFKRPGRYRVVVDAYPKAAGVAKNFQLFDWVTVAGTAPRKLIPDFQQSVETKGFTVTMQGKPELKALTAALIDVTVTDPDGKPATFTPYYGALAHAIFFREGSLDYFHTHVCAPGTTGCTSRLGGAQVTGTTTAPGKLQVGVLVPVKGRWRLFVQVRANGKLLTAPFTLDVQ